MERPVRVSWEMGVPLAGKATRKGEGSEQIRSRPPQARRRLRVWRCTGRCAGTGRGTWRLALVLVDKQRAGEGKCQSQVQTERGGGRGRGRENKTGQEGHSAMATQHQHFNHLVDEQQLEHSEMLWGIRRWVDGSPCTVARPDQCQRSSPIQLRKKVEEWKEVEESYSKLQRRH